MISYKEYLDKVYGCFLGKTVFGTLGAPFEGIKMPLEIPFRREMIDSMLPNDDLDLQVLWLDVVQERGADFTSADLQKRFCECCSYNPGEYAIMRKNYLRGIYPPLSGDFCNDYYRNGMGCPIRSEIWGCLAPLDPVKAADFSSRDGVLDHVGDSVLAERFFAAMESAAFGENDPMRLIKTGLSVIPGTGKFRQLLDDVLYFCEKYDDVKTILRKILFRYGHPDCTNMYQNIAITLIAFLKNDLDLIRTGMSALNCGFDTDCTCATAGALIGVIKGADALIREYDLKDVKYVLSVTSERRSDSVSDLAEDIAVLGAKLSGGRIVGAPQADFSFVPSMIPLKFDVSYENNDPTFYPGKNCKAFLSIKNVSDETQDLTLHLSGAYLEDTFSVCLAPSSSTVKEFVFRFPLEETVIREKNIVELTYSCNAEVKRFTFGVIGALPWKVIGPIWRTDPICDTEKLLSVGLKYQEIIKAVPYDGHRMDVTRRFHLNCCPDTDTVFFTPDECFESSGKEFEESVFYQREDAFRMEDLYGFSAPSVAYLAREMIVPEDRTVFLQIGYSSPFAVWINGKLVAERKECDTWDAENVHLAGIELKKGINRVVVRLTRVNGDAKYNFTFAKKASMGEHYVDTAVIIPTINEA